MARTTSSGIGLFLLLTALLSSVFYALIIGSGGHLAAARGMYITGIMWSPGLAAVLTCLLRRDGLAGLGWGWGRWRWQWLAYLLPLAYTAIAYAAVWLTGLGRFGNPAFVDKLAVMLGWPGMPSWLAILATFLLLASIGVMRSCANALGEEIGWRGFLTPRMVDRFGFTTGSLLVGLIWGAWHIPALLLTDYNAGTPWWFAIPCFLLLTTSCSVIMAWLRLRSGSLWTGVLAHASHNLFIQGFFTPITLSTGAVTPWAIDEFGFMVPLVMALMAVYFWRRRGELSLASPRAAGAIPAAA